MPILLYNTFLIHKSGVCCGAVETRQIYHILAICSTMVINETIGVT